MEMLHLSLLTFTLLMLAWIPGSTAGNILVFPLDGSHWVNMKVLVEELHAKGHALTVIRPKDSWYISERSPLYTSVTIQVNVGYEENFETFVAPQLELLFQAKSTSIWSRFWTQLKLALMTGHQFIELHKGITEMLIHMFEDEDMMRSLQDANFDLVLTDPCFSGGVLLARKLQVPLVYNVRWTTEGEAHLLMAPTPLSYVPFTATELTDRMTFSQRVTNVMSYVIGSYVLSTMTQSCYKPVLTRFFGPDVDYSSLLLDADIWLMRTDFVFDFPRPTMPNFVYISGFQCKPPKPLPADLEAFVQSSGDHGVIVMTLGTVIGTLPKEVAEEIAAAFAQVPQKVIWRHTGQRPVGLGNNTLLVDWLPQNDLLGHSKTKAFVCHGGTNGVQEAIYHGVPIVGLSLLFDQPENHFKIKARGGAAVVKLAMLDRHVFKDALTAVLYNPSFRENMQRLSRLHRDQPMKPLSQAVFWIEYVMRHRGAGHLKPQSIKMSWFTYHSLDVIAALLAIVLLFTFSCIAIARLLWRKICGGEKVKHE